jgi:hypothetical protein
MASGSPNANEAIGHTKAQQHLVSKINQAFKLIVARMRKVHQDAVTLIKMEASQLESSRALLNDLVTNATAAYTGQFDPATGGNINGIAWVYEELQGIATIPVTASTHKSE